MQIKFGNIFSTILLLSLATINSMENPQLEKLDTSWSKSEVVSKDVLYPLRSKGIAGRESLKDALKIEQENIEYALKELQTRKNEKGYGRMWMAIVAGYISDIKNNNPSKADDYQAQYDAIIKNADFGARDVLPKNRYAENALYDLNRTSRMVSKEVFEEWKQAALKEINLIADENDKNYYQKIYDMIMARRAVFDKSDIGISQLITLEYAYIYNTTNLSIKQGEPVTFDSNGPMTAGIMHNLNSSDIILAKAGTYEVHFSICAVFSPTFSLFLNGKCIAGSTYQERNPMYTIMSVNAGDVLTLRENLELFRANFPNAAPIQVRSIKSANVGIPEKLSPEQRPVNTSIIIKQLVSH